jgi:dihydrofolate reductase
MRKLILYMHVSLDGYIEGANGDMSWISPDDDQQWNELFTFLEDVDLLVLGRGMWTGYRNYWRKALLEPGFSPNEVKYAKLAANSRHLIFSNTLTDPQWPNATVVPGSAVQEVKKIKEQSGKNIQLVGGATFAASLIDAGLVDQYRILVNPAIVTTGKSFQQQLTVKRSLQLIEAKKMGNGVALLVYDDITKQQQ